MAPDQYNHNGDKTSGQGWQYDPGSGGSPTPPKKQFDIGEWIPIIILFCIPSGVTQIIAVIWALKKIADMMSHAQKQKLGSDVRRAAGHVKREVEDAFRDFRSTTQTGSQTSGKSSAQTQSQTGTRNQSQSQSQTQSDARQQGAYAQPRYEAPKKPAKIKGGSGLVIGGSIVAGIFGFSFLTVLIDSLSYGTFLYDLPGALACALFCAAGLVMLGCGIGKNRRRDRFRDYLAYIGANREVRLAPMAASFGVSVQKLCKDLRKMLADKILPTGYLDLAAGTLFLTEMGYRAPEPEPAEAPMDAGSDDEILREIRQINDDIPDAEMSAKIDRIEEITAKILAYQKTHPNRSTQLRSFLNYYLPTTLKILRAYAQLDAQGIEGENISAAKNRIEGMMDQVVAGFEKQLDKLFQDDAMDISTDVQVLENMLKKDGLSGDGQTMVL